MITATTPQRRGAIVLAGGDGTRLRALTAALYGTAVPKQYCPLFGNRETMLDWTMRRVALSVRPQCTTTIVVRGHRKFYEYLAANGATGELVVQPENRGTAPAVLYGLLRLANRVQPDAVAIFPSDHYVDNDRRFMNHVDQAFDAVQASPGLIILLGIAPTAAEVQYGWIELGESLMSWPLSRGMYRIRHFYEKPSHLLAEKLYAQGCLWNSFVLVATPRTLLALCRKALPRLYTSFDAIWATFGSQFETNAASKAYNDMPSVSFSEAVLGNYCDEMAVLRVSECMWTDLGTPERLLPILKILGTGGQVAALPGASPIAMETKSRRPSEVGRRGNA